MAVRMKEFFSSVDEPLMMSYRVNAGYISLDHWVHDPEIGGGRIIGEVCHFIDFLTYLSGSLPVRIYAQALPDNNRYRNDNLTVTIAYGNGSTGTVTYVANADKAYPKERVEVFGGGSVAVLDNFRQLELSKNGKRNVVKSRLQQDKGHRGEWLAFVDAVCGRSDRTIHVDETVSASLSTFCVIDSLNQGQPVRVEREAVVSG